MHGDGNSLERNESAPLFNFAQFSTIHRQRGSVGHRVWAFARKTGFVEAFQSDLEKLFALSLTQIYRCSPKNSDGQVSPEKCQS
jgi:hypothetical protein